MKAIVDTDYRDTCAQGACVLFREWHDSTPAKIYRAVLKETAPYEPGSFYKRELPVLLHALQQVTEPIDLIVIDGYVWLGENRGGLGWHLYEALDQSVPVIGVAKTSFRGAEAVAQPVFRGQSQKPLWITAIGIEVSEAIRFIEKMDGKYRIPTLIKLADTACREWTPHRNITTS